MPKKTPPSKVSSTPATPKSKAAAKKATPATRRTRAAKSKSKDDASKSKNLGTDLPTQAELGSLRGYPRLTFKDIAHEVRAPAGYKAIAEATLASWQEIDSELPLPGLTTDMLSKPLGIVDALAPIEQKLEPYWERAYYNRLLADADAMTALLAFARAIKGIGDPDLLDRFQPLIDWISSLHTPKTKGTKKQPVAGASATTNGKG